MIVLSVMFIIATECAESKIKDTVAYRQRKKVVTLHVDIIGEQFWTEHPEILAVA